MGKRPFVDVLNNLEMEGLSWIIQVAPKCHHKCPYKRKKEGDLTQIGEEAMGLKKQRLDGCSYKPWNVGSHQNLEATSCGVSQGIYGGNTALLTPRSSMAQ